MYDHSKHNFNNASLCYIEFKKLNAKTQQDTYLWYRQRIHQ